MAQQLQDGVLSMEVGGAQLLHSLDGTSHTTPSCDWVMAPGSQLRSLTAASRSSLHVHVLWSNRGSPVLTHTHIEPEDVDLN